MNWLKRHPIWTAPIILSLAAAGFNYFSSRRNSSRLSYAEKAADDCTPVGSELAQVKTCLLQAGFDINQMPPADRTLTLYVGAKHKLSRKPEIFLSMPAATGSYLDGSLASLGMWRRF
jgi:hypothetical protein